LKRADIPFLTCQPCGEELPENAFQKNSLQAWRANDQAHMIRCANCVLGEDTAYSGAMRTCSRYKVVLPLQQPGRTHTRHWGSVLLRVHLDHPNAQMKWTCYNCQYPPCTMCQQRSEFALTSDTDRSTYRCDVGACQYPHCAGSGCTTPRPRDIPFSQQQQWLCKHCKLPTETAAKTKTCVTCGKEKNANEYDDHADNKRVRRCRACLQKNRECIGCGTMKPAGDFEHSATRPKEHCKICDAMRKPTDCIRCGRTKPKSDLCHGTNKNRPHDYCAACKDHKQCAVETCKAWCDSDAERWTTKQKILVCGACKSDRGCTEKESALNNKWNKRSSLGEVFNIFHLAGFKWS
jgi:hypothetical protein